MITETQIFAAVVTTIEAGLTSRGITISPLNGKQPVAAVKVQKWYQQRTIGAPAGMAILISNISDHRYGFLGTYDYTEDGIKQHKEVQANEIKLQCTGQSPAAPPPADLPIYTSGDLASLAATILASDAGRQMLRAAGLGIERITDVRQPYFQDEKGQFESVSSFDFVLAFNQIEKTQIPIVTENTLLVVAV